MEIDEQELSSLRHEPFVGVDELSVIMEEVQADEETDRNLRVILLYHSI